MALQGTIPIRGQDMTKRKTQTGPHSFDKEFNRIVAVAADTVSELRACDVLRVMEGARDQGCVANFSDWLAEKRPEFTAEIDEAFKIVQGLEEPDEATQADVPVIKREWADHEAASGWDEADTSSDQDDSAASTDEVEEGEPEAAPAVRALLLVSQDGGDYGLVAEDAARQMAETFAADDHCAIQALDPTTQEVVWTVEPPAEPVAVTPSVEPRGNDERSAGRVMLVIEGDFEGEAARVYAKMAARKLGAPVTLTDPQTGAVIEVVDTATARGQNGRDVMFELLQRPEGATKAELMAATGSTVNPDLRAIAKARKCAIAKEYTTGGFRYHADLSGPAGEFMAYRAPHPANDHHAGQEAAD